MATLVLISRVPLASLIIILTKQLKYSTFCFKVTRL